MNIESFLAQLRRSEERINSTAEERERRLGNVHAEWWNAEEMDRVMRRLSSKGMTSEYAAVARASDAPATLDFNPLERIIEENDLVSSTFLYGAAALARSVGRVVIRSRTGRVLGHGTGFLVSRRLMMTNNHVLETARNAASSTIQFNYWETETGRAGTVSEFTLNPGSSGFFVTSEPLDYTLVAVNPGDGDDLSHLGWTPLIEDSGKAVLNERVTVIQHPGGEPQQVAVHNNKITNVVGDFLHYKADTERGSSGSPVLSMDLELAALHHAGVVKRDAQGRILLVDNSVWSGSSSDVGRIAWVANEGVRVSRIVTDLKRRASRFTTTQKRLFDAAFETRPPFEATLGFGRTTPSGTERGDAADPSLARVTADGQAEWTVPLRLRVALGDLGRPFATPVASAGDRPRPAEPSAAGADDTASVDMTTSPDYEQALAILEDSASRPYLDEDEDEENAFTYFEDLPWELSGARLFRELSSLLTETHRTRVRYDRARLHHLYPWVDLHENESGQRELRSIYSGRGFDPTEVLRLDFEIQRRRERMMRELLASGESFSEDAMNEALAELEAHSPFNCEHVVCQSWFGRSEPMRGDLHHLFACESGCNSFRSNIPYWQFAPEDERVREACGERVGKKFEPAAGKGPVARATLYFLLRYPGRVGEDSDELTTDRLPILIDWHESDPPSRYERHRNAAIFEIQGNRNPLIDYPEWAATADFARGFAG